VEEYTQVEKAIFKVSRHLLSKHSSVIEDMFKLPQEGFNQSGIDERPVILVGDSVEGWEIFLSILYPEYCPISSTRFHANLKQSRNLLDPIDIYSGLQLDSLFPVVLKYSMESIEKAIIKHLETTKGTHDAASLMMISQMLRSDQLYEKAKNKLIQHSDHLQPEDATRIGASAVYEVMLGRYNKKPVPKPRITYCNSCTGNNSFRLSCNNCGRTEPY
jgi:hypothetical protein